MRTTLTLLLAACTGSPSSSTPDDAAPGTDTAADTDSSVVMLSDTDRLLRIAMALKGTRPSIADFEAVEQDPAALSDIVDGYLESAQFLETVQDIENQTLLVRRENAPNHTVPDAEDLGDMDVAYYRNEEPLKLIAHVVESDRPYTDILTMEGTVGSQYHDRLWDSVEGDFDPDGPEWQPMRYTDGRGNAGVLTTNGWHARWASNPNNAHRLGAAQATAALICADYLTDDVQLGSIDLTDDDAIFNAILEEPACVSCHQTMDPFAGALFGYAGRVESNNAFPTAMYDADEADDGFRRTGRETGYYGLGGDNLTEVAALMAQDSRFTSCTARRYLGWMHQKPLDDIPLAEVTAAQATLIDSGMDLKAMVRHIVLSDDFAASHATDVDEAESTHGLLHTRPRQLSRFFADMAGFTWEGTYNQGSVFVVPNSATRGFQVHGGGIEVNEKRTPIHMHSASGSAFLRTFAAEAAAHVVVTDFSLPADERVLLTEAELETKDEATLRSQLAALHLRIYGERVEPDSTEVDETLALMLALDDLNRSRERVWIMVLTAMFQDLRVATY